MQTCPSLKHYSTYTHARTDAHAHPNKDRPAPHLWEKRTGGAAAAVLEVPVLAAAATAAPAAAAGGASPPHGAERTQLRGGASRGCGAVQGERCQNGEDGGLQSKGGKRRMNGSSCACRSVRPIGKVWTRLHTVTPTDWSMRRRGAVGVLEG
eukprot:scaffold67316_cov20-Tisochrysis_lutea.AAC.1